MKNGAGEFLKNRWAELLAILLTVLGVVGAFIGPFYTLDTGAEIGLIDLIANNPAGVRVAVLFTAVMLVLPILSIALSLISFKKKQLAIFPLMIMLSVAIISLILRDSLSEGFAAYTDWAEEIAVKQVHFASIFASISFFLSAFFSFFASARVERFSIADIVEMGMLVAMATALNVIRLFRMPTGGSVNFQMLPLFILALRRGPLKGFIGAGIVYGLITCLTDGYGFATFPFDYLLGFGSVALVGVFSPFILKKGLKGYNLKGLLFILIACVLSTFVRFIAGTVSSIVIYNYGFSAAAIYNIGYIGISGAMATAVLMVLYAPLLSLNARFPALDESEEE